jgi:hypothetical protein
MLLERSITRPQHARPQRGPDPELPPRPVSRQEFGVRLLVAGAIVASTPVMVAIILLQALAVSSALVLGHQLGGDDPQSWAVATTTALAICALVSGAIAWVRGAAYCRGMDTRARVSGVWFLTFVVLAVAWAAVVVSAGWIGVSHGD